MNDWSLSRLLSGLHNDIQHRLQEARQCFAHPGTMGDASERVWVELLDKYLPKRYQAATAHVVDSNGSFSDQIDVVVFDRQYSPFIFTKEGQLIIPAESVYAVFESKQTLNADLVRYASKKIASVRKLHRTSMPIPHAGGTYPAKPLIPILGGVLTFESDWSPPIDKALDAVLSQSSDHDRLELGCIAAHGMFSYDNSDAKYSYDRGGKPATAFLFKLISRLQFSGTVPMIDVQAYGRWLSE